jgi:predicted kinase
MDARPTLYLMVGLPATGKTTHARQLEVEKQALRLTPDEWMIPLFAHPDPDGQRWVLEGRLVWVAIRALRLGVSVIIDFGLWARDERSALRWLAAQAGADCTLVYLEVSDAEQQRRLEARFASDPDSNYELSHFNLEEFRGIFQVPDENELSARHLAEPPDGYETWELWTTEHWPTSFP